MEYVFDEHDEMIIIAHDGMKYKVFVRDDGSLMMSLL